MKETLCSILKRVAIGATNMIWGLNGMMLYDILTR